MIPALHPQASENKYEMIPNKGFQSHENTPPRETRGANLIPHHSSQSEIVVNEGYESVESARPRNFSVSNNPMYSTSSVTNKAKKVLAVDDDSKPMKNPHFVEYDVPKDGVRPKPSSSAVVVPDAGNSPQNANLRAWGSSKAVDIPTGVKYDVPLNNTPAHNATASAQQQQRSATISFPSPESMTSNPIYSAHYDVPTRNHKEANGSKDNERGTENHLANHAAAKASASATYDVPHEYPLPKPKHVMYDVPRHRSKTLEPAKKNQTRNNDSLPHQPHSNFVMIDILPLPGKKTDAEKLRPQASPAAYDVPPSRPREKVGTNTNSPSNTFYKYDIPPSNIPAPKLDTS